MAIYHLSTKPISRSSGRSAVASIAYRAGIEITDERLGKTYDYTKRNGVLWTGLATPHGFNINRNELWNKAEKIETRSNSRTAREIVINIPHELMQGDQSAGKMLAYEFATNLSQKYQVAVDVAVHAPDKQGDNRNYHAHLLLTTRQIFQEQDGIFELGKKSQLEMSNAQLKQAGLLSNQDELKEIRREWAELANEYLAQRGIDERIDHRSHKDRGLETLPTVKLGWKATEQERQGIKTELGDKNRAIQAYNAEIEQRNKLKEQLKAEKSVQTTTVPNPKPKQSALNDPKPTSPDEIIQAQRVLITQYSQQVRQIAHQILDDELKVLRTQARALLEQYNQIKTNKPLFFGKKTWEENKNQLLQQYNQLKNTHDKKKETGLSKEYYQQALSRMEQDKPSYHRQAQQAIRDVERYEQTKIERTIQSFKVMDKEQRKNLERQYQDVITQYTAELNQRAVALYYEATPEHQREKPLFSHYAEHDMRSVQPYKKIAQEQMSQNNPNQYYDYREAIAYVNELTALARYDGVQRQIERIQEMKQGRGR